MKKIFQNKNILQKIAIVVLITIVVNFTIPTFSFAGFGGDLLKALLQLIAAIGDVVMGAFNHFMLGTDYMIGSVMLDRDNPSLTSPEGALYPGGDNAESEVIVLDSEKTEEKLDGSLYGDSEDDWEVPNLLYSPEAIFSNHIAALDVNFLNPNDNYQPVQTDDLSEDAAKRSESAALQLQNSIGSWYITFRNIAVVVLLTILVYIGIRIIISSTSIEKAKYKESLRDWLVAICLVFVIHFIMAAILMIIDQVSVLFGGAASGIIVESEGTKMKLSLMGLARLRVQSYDLGTAAVFCVMYIVLVIFTILFTVAYLKRFLYMAFLTMIAPLVAITYPIDKIGDGKAQAFSFWFKEYIMNAILQPLHLILYTTIVGTAQSLVSENFIFALGAIGFLIPAEKFIKSMFGFNKGESSGALGGFAAGALAMQGLKTLSRQKVHGGKGGDNNNKIRTANGDKNPPLTGKSENKGLDSVNFENEENPDGNLGLGQGDPDIDIKGANNNNNNNNNNGFGGTANNQDFQQEDYKEPEMGDLSFNDYGAIIKGGFGSDGTFYGDKYIPREKFGHALHKEERKRKNALRREKTIAGAKAIGGALWDRKGAIAKAAGRTARRGISLGGGALLGASFALANGDYSKIGGYMLGGAVATDAITKNAVDGVTRLGRGTLSAGKDISEEMKYRYDEESKGILEAEEEKQKRINKRAEKEFMKDAEQLKIAKKIQAKLKKSGHNAEINDVMKSRYDYLAANVKDENKIQRAIIAEAESGKVNGSSHNNYVGLAKATEELGINSNTFVDNKKYNELHDVLSARWGEKNGAEGMRGIAQIIGDSAVQSNKYQSKNRQSQKKKK